MEFLHPIDRTRKKENSHRAGLRSSFFSWAHALTSAQREVAYSGLRHALTRKQHEISLHGNAAMHCEDAEWKRQNREAAISEAQKRANQSGLDFTVFRSEERRVGKECRL